MKVTLVYRALKCQGADNMIVWTIPSCDILKLEVTWKYHWSIEG